MIIFILNIFLTIFTLMSILLRSGKPLGEHLATVFCNVTYIFLCAKFTQHWKSGTPSARICHVNGMSLYTSECKTFILSNREECNLDEQNIHLHEPGCNDPDLTKDTTQNI